MKDLEKSFFQIHDKNAKKLLKTKFTELYNSKLSEDAKTKRVQQLRSWNPFEVDKPAEYFDSKLMFNVDRFNLVIGNPPYIHFEDIKEDSKNIYKPLKYETYEARGDIYTLFYEMGINCLTKNGFLCYITSNKWMRAGYGSSLRNFFIEFSNPLLLIDLGSGVFESATVDTNILLIQNSDNTSKIDAVTLSQKVKETELVNFVDSNSITLSFNKDQPWIIMSPIELSIKKKIEDKGRPLKDWPNIKFSRGILTGLTEAFVIDKTKREEILKNCQTDEERKRTELLIHPVLRGRDVYRDKFEWNGEYLINLHNGYRTKSGIRVDRLKIEDYPSVKVHLDSFFEKLSKRTDKGDTIYNLRNCAYIEDFYNEKVVYTAVNSEYRFATIPSGYFFNNSVFMITGMVNDKLSMFCNSGVIRVFLGIVLGGDNYEYGGKETFEKMPIPKEYANFQNEFDIINYYSFDELEIRYILDKIGSRE